MLTRTKSREAAERIHNNGSTDLLGDLHLVVDDALKHGEIHKASVYCDALMRVALGEPPGYISNRVSCEKSITYKKSAKAKCVASLPRVMVAVTVGILFLNHFPISSFLTDRLMDHGLIGPASLLVDSELAIEELTSSTHIKTIEAKVDILGLDARFDEALKLDNAMLARHEDSGRFITNKITSLKYSGRYEEVIATADEARSSLTGFYRDSLELNAAEAYTHLNDGNGAVNSWFAIESQTLRTSPHAKVVQARINYMQGDRDGARENLRKALFRTGLRRMFKSDDLSWAAAAFLQADILQSAGKESRANRLRHRAETLLAKNHLTKMPDLLVQQ